MYRFGLARPDEDAALRAVLAATPMPGNIRVAFGREPSYFGGALVEGRFRQALAAREAVGGAIVGIGARSTMRRFVNGTPREIGYLSGLRILPAHRNRHIMARGYGFLRELHADARTAGYLTTVASDNAAALDVLTGGRAGLPVYHVLGEYRTAAIPVRTRWRPGGARDVRIRSARREDATRIMEFLGRVGGSRQFFPCYQAGDLFAEGGLLQGLAPDDIQLAFRGRRLVGVLGAWDQHAFRQTVIAGYGGALRSLRPLYNVLARPLGRPRLPAPGEALRSLNGALPLAEDAEVFGALLAAVLDRARSDAPNRGGAPDYFMLGLAANDPLGAALHDAPARCYRAQAFYVCWPDGEELFRSLDRRPLYLELGSL